MKLKLYTLIGVASLAASLNGSFPKDLQVAAIKGEKAAAQRLLNEYAAAKNKRMAALRITTYTGKTIDELQAIVAGTVAPAPVKAVTPIVTPKTPETPKKLEGPKGTPALGAATRQRKTVRFADTHDTRGSGVTKRIGAAKRHEDEAHKANVEAMRLAELKRQEDAKKPIADTKSKKESEEAAKRKADEQARHDQEAKARMRAHTTRMAAQKDEQATHDAQKQAEKQKAAEQAKAEEAQRKAAQDAAMKLQAEEKAKREEAQKKAQQDAAAKLKADEQAKQDAQKKADDATKAQKDADAQKAEEAKAAAERTANLKKLQADFIAKRKKLNENK